MDHSGGPSIDTPFYGSSGIYCLFHLLRSARRLVSRGMTTAQEVTSYADLKGKEPLLWSFVIPPTSSLGLSAAASLNEIKKGSIARGSDMGLPPALSTRLIAPRYQPLLPSLTSYSASLSSVATELFNRSATDIFSRRRWAA